MVVNLYEKTNAITIFDIPYPYFEGELSVSSAQRRTWLPGKFRNLLSKHQVVRMSEMHVREFTIMWAVSGHAQLNQKMWYALAHRAKQ